MKTVNFADFRERISEFISEVEKGEQLVLIRHGNPVAEIHPYKNSNKDVPAWKQPFLSIEMKGNDLSSAIIDERKTTNE